MEVTTFTHARQNLAKLMDEVERDGVPYVVTRQGKKPVVMISLEEWNSIVETLHLQASPVNAKRLEEAIAELNAGRGIAKSLDDL